MTRLPHPRPAGQRGQAIVLIAMMMVILVGFVALAIDSARAFDARRMMQDSVDSSALAAAEYYQNNSGGWAAAENTAANLFATDNRLYSGHSCNPGSVTPAVGGPGAPLTMSCTFGVTGYTLSITAEDDGPAGQSFTLSGQRSLQLALIEVLGGSPSISVSATGTATAGDGARLPALAGLSEAGCFGVSGTYPISITNFTNPVTIVGDVVADGTFDIGAHSFPRVAGNVLTRCAAPNNAANLSYYCWQSGAAPPCAAGSVAGRLLSTSYDLADPAFSPPPAPGATAAFNATSVLVSPGIYTSNPNFGSTSAYCYFLAPGVYEWQSNLTVSRGIVSNELKPPDEPDLTDATGRTVSSHQFWNDNGASCAGSFSLSSGGAPGKGIRDGTWSVVVTALRTETVGASSFLRESAPSACRQLVVSGPDKTLAVTVNNVPGAMGYNVYAAQPPTAGGTSSCTGPFGLVAANSIATNPATETQGSLGTASGSWDSTTLPDTWTPLAGASPDTSKAYPPDPETSPWNGSTTLPNQGPGRGATASTGDRANQNRCAAATGAGAVCPAAVTPGAVVMDFTSGSCFNIADNFSNGGDLYIFSGYQYDWMLNYQPQGSACADTWDGFVNTAAIGFSYLPSANLVVLGSTGFSSYTGGVVASTISVTLASGLLIDLSRNYAPSPGGTLLTG